jgi:hypothetical protein
MTTDEKKGQRPTDDVAGSATPSKEDEPDAQDAARDLGDVDAPEEIEAPPHAVAELCAACVRFVATRYQVALDFSQDTLSLVDQYVADARAEIAALSGDRASAVGASTIDIVQASAGAYLGEVIRRRFGGAWFAEGEHDAWRVDMESVFLTFNPIGMMREALALEPQEGWHAHLEMDPAEKESVERRLAALPDVEDAEYYAPTTRFDVVEIAVAALRAQMVAAGHGDVRFTAEDYRGK